MRQLGVEVNFSDGESVNLTETLRLRRSQSLIAQAQSGKQEPIRFERQGHKKRPPKMESLFIIALGQT